MTMQRTPAATCFPSSIFAAAAMSRMRPLVHAPMKTWWISGEPHSRTGLTLSGECGMAATGTIFSMSNVSVRKYAASASG